MDIAWQKLLGITTPVLPGYFRSEHFTNSELNEILRSWSGGNTLNNPTDIATFVERIYTFDSWEDLSAEPWYQQMYKDGLGRCLITTWTMVAAKKNIPI